MDDIKYIISYIVEKCLQWLYATRKKRFGHRIIVGIILLVLLVLGLALILYILEAFLLYNCIGNNDADFARILSVVVSTVILIILLNWGTGQDNYSEVLLSYYYIISKRKRYQYNWIKIIVILFVIVFLISTLCKEIDIIAQALKFSLPETIIIGFVIISLFIYIPLTECVIDEVKFYRVKSIASIVQFLILLVIYITSMMDMSSDDVGNIYDIMIFAIGQIAFAESAISNYKSMYKKLKEEKKDEVEKYLEGVDKQYEKNEEMMRSDIKEAKNFVGEIVDLWSKMNWKQRIKVVGVFVGIYRFLCVSYMDINIIEQYINIYIFVFM